MKSMTKNNLSEYKTHDNMIKYITIHIVYLMDVLNKLCLNVWYLKNGWAKEGGGQFSGLLYIITGIIAFQVV